MNIDQLYTIFEAHPSIATDTRQVKPGDLFFALRGPHFNGNKFAADALSAGAAFAVIDDEDVDIGDQTILVPDVLTTLQQLAKFHRQSLSIPFLAITGSNGKTTTKELIHAVLASTFATYTTVGNLNNHIGVPLTLLKIRRDAQMAVIEMGANHLLEIAGYCRYTLPSHGLITNTGKAHLEGFGSLEGVRKGKGELFDYLRSTNGTAFVMHDYENLVAMTTGIREVVEYGTKVGEVTGEVSKTDPFLAVRLTSGTTIDLVQTQLVGAYNLPNVLAAITIGKYFHVPDERIKTAIEAYAPSNSRSQLIKKYSNHFILDAYNANPSSMRSAIENFAGMRAERKVLILGAMAELGTESLDEHLALVALIKQYQWEQVVLVGSDFMKIDHPFICLPDAVEGRQWFRQQHFTDTYMLVKGSRSMAMERILE